jgi:lipopolysaccharide export system protein LptC
MNDRSIPLMPLGILVLLACLTFWLSRYVDNEGARAKDSRRQDPDVMIEKFTAQKLSPAGDVQYIVTADKMKHYPHDDSSLFEQVVFKSTAPGQPTVTIRAPRGKSVNGGDEVVMDGGVLIDAAATGRSPAMQMRTPKLTVLPEKSLAKSNDGVVIESVQGVMRAATFEFNNETRELKMERFKAVLQSGTR